MRVAECPAGDQRLAKVRLAVTVGVLEINRLAPVLHDRSTAIERDRCRNRQPFGEDRELVRLAVVVRVLADANAVATLRWLLQFIRIVERFAKPQSAPLVPVHRQRLADLRISRIQLDRETDRRDEVLDRLFGWQRLLQFLDRLRDRPPLLARRIKRDHRIDVLKRLHVLSRSRHLRPIGKARHFADVIIARPANATLDEILKSRIAPRPLVVSPSGVEHSPLAVSPHPSPRFLAFAFRASLQHDAIFLVVLRVDVGLIKTFKPAIALQQRMRLARLSRRDSKRPRPVPQELPTHQRDDVVVVPKAVARTVQRDEALATGDVIEQRLGLVILDLVDVREQHQPVELRELLVIQVADDIGVFQLNPASLHHRLQLPEPSTRLMMPVVTKIQQLERFGFRRKRLVSRFDGRHKSQQTQNTREETHLKTPGQCQINGLYEVRLP